MSKNLKRMHSCTRHIKCLVHFLCFKWQKGVAREVFEFMKVDVERRGLSKNKIRTLR